MSVATTPHRVCVAGASGRMGRMLIEAVRDSGDCRLSGALDVAASPAIGQDAGAYAGHQVEKKMKSTTYYDVVVNMNDGTTRTFSYDTQPAFQVGSKVRVVNGALTAS